MQKVLNLAEWRTLQPENTIDFVNSKRIVLEVVSPTDTIWAASFDDINEDTGELEEVQRFIACTSGRDKIEITHKGDVKISASKPVGYLTKNGKTVTFKSEKPTKVKPHSPQQLSPEMEYMRREVHFNRMLMEKQIEEMRAQYEEKSNVGNSETEQASPENGKTAKSAKTDDAVDKKSDPSASGKSGDDTTSQPEGSKKETDEPAVSKDE
jgi:hypothetical protein